MEDGGTGGRSTDGGIGARSLAPFAAARAGAGLPSRMSDDLPYAAELRRKAIHLGALVLPAGILVLGRPLAAFALVPLACLAVALDWSRVRFEAPRRVLHVVFAGLMRAHEVPAMGAPVVLNGATWMCVAAALCAVVFEPAVGAASLAMLMVGDGAAAVVGRRFGRTKWPDGVKSVEGTVAYAATAFATGLVVVFWPFAHDGPRLTLAACTVGAVVGAAIEAVPIPVNDNVRVPLVAGAAMALVVALS